MSKRRILRLLNWEMFRRVLYINCYSLFLHMFSFIESDSHSGVNKLKKDLTRIEFRMTQGFFCKHFSVSAKNVSVVIWADDKDF